MRVALSGVPAVNSEGRAARGRARLVLLSIGLAASCSEGVLVAPNGSRMDLTAAATTIAGNGGTTMVSALLTEEDGVFAEDGTTVAFMTSGGEVCTPAADAPAECAWSTITIAKTRDGVAQALVRAGVGNTMTVEARSGSIKATRDLTISSLVAPAGGSMLVEAEPDTVAAGGSSQILAFVSTADGAPVPEFTRVVFTTSSGKLSRNIALTEDGFAGTTLTAGAAGAAVVSIVSGAVRDSATITVQ